MNKNYDDLSTWDFWSLEEKLGNILQDKGYGIVSFDLEYNIVGQLVPCLQVNTKVANTLAAEIRKQGYIVEVKQRIDKRRFSYIFIKNHYPVELLLVADSFEVIA